MEVRIVKDLAKRWGAKNEELSPQRTQRAQRGGEEGEGRERQLKVESGRLRVSPKREESTALRGSDGQKDEEFLTQRAQRAQRRGEEERIREERKDEEFSPPRPGRGRRRTQRTQRAQR